jgi:TonB family protein
VLTAPPEATPIRAADLMRVRPAEAFGVWGAAPSIAQTQADRARARSLVDLPQGTPESRAVAASQGYVDQRLAATHQHEAPGVRGYYWSLRRRMLESWRPGISHVPSIGDTLLATVAAPPAALAEILRSANGAAVAPGRQGAAIDALEAGNTARSNNPAERTQAPFQGIIDGSRANTRTTRAEVEVVQGEDGRVIEVRVLRSSHIAGFDRAAEAAVRDALPLQAPVAMPGGRRSRWSFEVVASRDPFVPGVGFEFDESSGWFELHWPGRVHVRSRVWLEGASPLQRVARSPRG